MGVLVEEPDYYLTGRMVLLDLTELASSEAETSAIRWVFEQYPDMQGVTYVQGEDGHMCAIFS